MLFRCRSSSSRVRAVLDPARGEGGPDRQGADIRIPRAGEGGASHGHGTHATHDTDPPDPAAGRPAHGAVHGASRCDDRQRRGAVDPRRPRDLGRRARARRTAYISLASDGTATHAFAVVTAGFAAIAVLAALLAHGATGSRAVT
jgi:hypothetical protein